MDKIDKFLIAAGIGSALLVIAGGLPRFDGESWFAVGLVVFWLGVWAHDLRKARHGR